MSAESTPITSAEIAAAVRDAASLTGAQLAENIGQWLTIERSKDTTATPSTRLSAHTHTIDEAADPPERPSLLMSQSAERIRATIIGTEQDFWISTDPGGATVAKLPAFATIRVDSTAALWLVHGENVTVIEEFR